MMYKYLIEIQANKAARKKEQTGKKMVTRGMISVKGIDYNNDDSDAFGGKGRFELRPTG